MKQSWHQYSKRAPKHARTGPDGFVYDSKTEMDRGIELKLLERAGEITDLQRQVKFPLSRGGDDPIVVMAGKNPAKYTPDFVYRENGQLVIEDVKGYPDENSKLRIRVFEALTGHKVRIIKKVKGQGWVQI